MRKSLIIFIVCLFILSGCANTPQNDYSNVSTSDIPRISNIGDYSTDKYITSEGDLSDYLDFSQSYYIGYTDRDEILYGNFDGKIIRSVNRNNGEITDIATLKTPTDGYIATTDFDKDWVVWSESKDDEIRIGESTGKNWGVYAINIETKEIIQMDAENSQFPVSRDYNAQPLFLSIDDGYVTYKGYQVINNTVEKVIKLYDLEKKKLKIVDSSPLNQADYSNPVTCNGSVFFTKISDNPQNIIYEYSAHTDTLNQIPSAEHLINLAAGDGFIAGSTSWTIDCPATLYIFDTQTKEWKFKLDAESRLYEDFQMDMLEFVELQADQQYLVWRPTISDILYIVDVPNSQIVKIPTQTNFWINYVLYPFNNHLLAWCASDSSGHSAYPYVMLQ